jgi:hypothetical protein
MTGIDLKKGHFKIHPAFEYTIKIILRLYREISIDILKNKTYVKYVIKGNYL